MDVHHPDAQPRGRRDRSRDGLRNVVKLEIQEDAIAACDDRLDDRRTLAGEESISDFLPAEAAAKLLRQYERLGGRSDIEGRQ